MSAPACGCLDSIEKALEKHHGAPIEFSGLSQWGNVNSGEMWTWLAPLRYSGGRGKKRFRSHVKFKFCPFCGKAIDQIATPASAADLAERGPQESEVAP